MNNGKNKISRRTFLAVSGAIAGTTVLDPNSRILANSATNARENGKKMRIALVGTGVRGVGMWGRSLLEEYPEYVQFVGLCDHNPGRLAVGKEMIGADCPTFTDFEEMMRETKPEVLIVTSDDDTHDLFVVKGMEMGADIICEKPMAIDEKKIQRIIDAEKRTGKKCRVTFNYRYSPHRAKMWEILRSGEIGEITSVDFHWYLDTSHGADYFRRWHRLVEKGGSLWVHKASHHFDLLNWWIETIPNRFYARWPGFLRENGPFRATNCRNCPTRRNVIFTLISPNERLIRLYVDNEKYDGYHRDGCVFRNDINIFDKMAATIKYKNGVQVSYSLTAYSPYEGYRIAFNGTKGRMDAWVQESKPTSDANYDEIVVFKNFGRREYIQIPQGGGHGGGDKLLKDQIFIPNTPDPLKQMAGVRTELWPRLIGTREEYRSGQPVMIGDLSTIQPMEKKMT